MKFKLIGLVGLLAITSCSNNNDEIPTENKQYPQAQNANKISWTYPVLSQPFAGLEQNYKFEYNSQGKVDKKIGGILKYSGASGVPDSFTSLIYTTISYNGNAAIVGTYSSDPSFNVALNERKYELDNQGRIVKSVIPSLNNLFEKTLTYTYDSSGHLVKIVTEFLNMTYNPTDPDDYILTYVEKFIYDNAGNLSKAITTENHNNTDVKIMQELEFSNFDIAQNAFKGLGIFPDYFYLSLSKNNYQKKIIKEFDDSNQVISTKESSWANVYNADGSLKLFY